MIPEREMSVTSRLCLSLCFHLAVSLVIDAPQALDRGPLNATVTSNDTPYCDSNINGHPPLGSCRETLEKLPDTTTTIFFRNRPVRPFDMITLPYRIMSRT